MFPDGSLWSGADGEVELGSAEPVTTETRFAIASITKSFTAATVLRLAERGELSIDDGLGEWLPRSADVEGITIRQVLSHTSGLATEVDPDQHPVCFPTCAPRGTCLSYSNLGRDRGATTQLHDFSPCPRAEPDERDDICQVRLCK